MNTYLKDRRKQLKLTQKQVAKFVDVSEATVSRWESGDIENMKRDKIAALAEILETTPAFIMSGRVENPTISEEKQKLLFLIERLTDEQALKLVPIVEEIKKIV